jgi:hypothetical protein
MNKHSLQVSAILAKKKGARGTNGLLLQCLVETACNDCCPPNNSLEPHTSPPISQYLPFSSPFHIPIDLTLLEFCFVCSCQLSRIWITHKMLFKPKLLMMFGLLWKEEEGYGQRWTRNFFKSENRKCENSCAHSAISNLNNIPMCATPQKANPQSFVIILQIANSQISTKILHKSFSKNNPKNLLLNELFYYVKI